MTTGVRRALVDCLRRAPEFERRVRALVDEYDLGKHDYASKRHALLTVLWHPGRRMGVAHSLDGSGFDAEDRALEIHHRPDTETSLKNKQSGERICALSEDALLLVRG